MYTCYTVRQSQLNDRRCRGARPRPGTQSMERPGGYEWPETGTDSPCKTLLLLATQLKYVIRGVKQTLTWVIG